MESLVCPALDVARFGGATLLVHQHRAVIVCDLSDLEICDVCHDGSYLDPVIITRTPSLQRKFIKRYPDSAVGHCYWCRSIRPIVVIVGVIWGSDNVCGLEIVYYTPLRQKD